MDGKPRHYLGYPDDWNMWIPDEIRKCVAFIGFKRIENGKEYYIPCGTGFFVSFSISGDMNFVYLMTARHVVENIGEKEVVVRVNLKNGEAKNCSVAKTIKWFYHPSDSNVDVAIIPFPASGLEFDIETIPIGMFLSADDLKKGKIGIGYEVFITGLFINHYGKQKNLPIVRIGNIAMISDEKVSVSWHEGCEIDAYLIEARSIGGISGSPVFFANSPFKGGSLILGGDRIFYFGGLIHGHYDNKEIDNTKESEKEKSEKSINTGIAIVVPAFKIMEVLKQKELEEMRIMVKKEYDQKNNSTKLD